MKSGRLTLIGLMVVASTFLAVPWSHGATTTTTATAGLPLFQFVNSGSGPLPWNAVSLKSAVNNTTMLGGPHTASDASEGALAYRTSSGDLALYTQDLTGKSRWVDLSSQNNNLPAPGADPVPFFDPSGAVDLLYVDSLGDLILSTANAPQAPAWHHFTSAPWKPYIGINLTELTGVTAANGLASIQVSGESAVITFRTASAVVEEVPVSWSSTVSVPGPSGPAVNVSAATSMGTAASDPIALPGAQPAFVTTSSGGDLELFTENVAAGTWAVQDLTLLTNGPKVAGTLAMASTASTLYISALGTTGSVELYSGVPGATTPTGATRSLGKGVRGPTTTAATTSSTASTTTTTPTTIAPTTTTTTTIAPTTTTTTSPTYWSVQNVTSAATGAPPLSGSIFIDATPTQISIAGQAANWGDLFVLTSPAASGPWAATDVSVTGGSAARTVGSTVAGLHLGASLALFAAGVNSPPPQGVGVYAIPSSKWSKAISDGWPIISETGGMGTTVTPWVGFTTAKSVATSPDFLLGQSIYNSHKRVTWLSFWTVSGPLASEPLNSTSYYNHGFTSGAWVAAQIDQYRGLGVGLTPDWVIFDPEGYPDNHSGVDAPGGSSTATIAKYATYWTAMLQGWVKGMASIDPSLHAGVYATQSEYRNYALSTQPLPVFVALAFSGGGPLPIAGASGSNVRGFIAWSAVCSPTTKLASERATLVSPPWSGAFNTLQFNAGVYCPPA